MSKTKQELEQEVEALKLALSKATEKKTETDWFIKTDGTVQDWKGCSETKRFFESKFPAFLAELNGGQRMTTKQFHELLAQRLGL